MFSKPKKEYEGWTLAHIPDLTGKTAIVTGANSGLGFALTESLFTNGCRVIMACRSPTKAKIAKKQIMAKHPTAHGRLIIKRLDVANFESIQTFYAYIADRVKRRGKISLLVNNAGIMKRPLMPVNGRTQEDNEIVFQTNCLGPHMLTMLLLPMLDADHGARIVTVGSLAARKGAIDLNKIDGDADNFVEASAYKNSKLGCVLMGIELGRRLQAHPTLKSIVAHPGYADTNILGERASIFESIAKTAGNLLIAQKPKKAIIPIMYACFGKDVQSGDYYGPSGMYELIGDHPTTAKLPEPVSDEKFSAAFFDECCKKTNTRFELDLPKSALR